MLARVLAVGSAVLVAGCVAAGPAQAKTDVYDEVATESIFVVPDGVHELTFVAIGGSGGDAQDGVGGAGAEVSGRVAVTPGQTLYVEVGENGEDLADGGGQVFGGGAAGGGGGGGASDIRTAPYADGLSPDPRLLVAGAGGGAGASGITEMGGNGGDAEMDRRRRQLLRAAERAPRPKGEWERRAVCGTTGDNGTRRQRRRRRRCRRNHRTRRRRQEAATSAAAAERAPANIGSGGGGGGSSLVPPLALSTLASPTASPLIEITWYPPPSITLLTPADGATYTQGQVVNANYSCLPGAGATLASCVGTVANGAAIDTSTVGSRTFTVDAEDKSKGKTTESVTYTVAAKSTKSPKPPKSPKSSAPKPNTILGSHPKKTIKTKKKKVKVKFGFSSNVKGATFKCKLDKGSFSKCSSPKTYKVKLGKHTFSVEAVSAGGTDPTPAKFSFKVKKKQ